MPVTYIPLATQTLGSAAASVTFSSISGAYTDLVLIMNPSMSASTNQPVITLNSDTGTNYSTTSLRGDGSSAASSRHSNIAGWYPVPGPGVGTNGNPEPWIVNIMNYSNTTTNKTALSRFNNAISYVTANVHLWRNTAAISTITITMESSATFNIGSTFSLYGVASSAVGAKATGGTIFKDSNYYYHTFLSSGTFTPTSTLSCDVLVVAGGGGGSQSGGSSFFNAGGGGAGGLLGFVSQSVASATTITVGAGGTGGNDNTGTNGTSGSNSQFGALTAAVGGGRGGLPNANGLSGGSGGGGGYAGTGGAATSGQGFAGGNGNGSNVPAGGGGAGAVGSQASGGVGVSTYSSWGAATGTGQNVSGTYFYAGGGGGGRNTTNGGSGVSNSGGNGGGGNGGVSNTSVALSPLTDGTLAVAGAANTGGGGGGAPGTYAFNFGGQNGAAGGSGIVIVRYPI